MPLVSRRDDSIGKRARLRFLALWARQRWTERVENEADCVGFDSLVWDDEQRRWVAARDHVLLLRIREIAAASPVTQQPWSAPSSRQQEAPAVVPKAKVYKSPLMQHKIPTSDGSALASEKPESSLSQ
jgi:hypothetical protein